MADKKISELTGGGAPQDTDEFPVARGGTTLKLLWSSLKAGFYTPGGTDVAVADGGTGASTAAGARQNLDVEYDVDVPAMSTFNDHSARHENGGGDEISIAGLDGVSTELANHLADAADAHDASAISSVPAGNLAATDVQTALNELDTEKAATASAVMDGDAAGGVLAGTYPNPSFAADMATQAELDAHLNDASDAHDASAISSVAAGNLSSTDVQAALNELDTEKQPLDSDLTDIAALSPTNDDIIQRKAGVWTNRTMAQLISDLAALGTTFQPLDSDLTSIAALSTTAFGRGLLTLADAAALLAAAGAAPSTRNLTAGNGLSGGGDLSADRTFTLNVDDSTVEINADTLRVKAGGITTSHLSFDVATQTELDAHLNDTTDAHDASAISVADAGSYFTGTEVEAALQELGPERVRAIQLVISDPAGSAITTGDSKGAPFVVPTFMNGWDLTACMAAVTTVSSSGLPTVQIRNETQTADMLTTKLSIDANERTSLTAATAAVIDTNNDDIASGDFIWVDIDVAGTGAKGLIVTLIFKKP